MGLNNNKPEDKVYSPSPSPPSSPYKSREWGNLGEFEEPPLIPEKGLVVPPTVAMYATKLRDRLRDDPFRVPYGLHCWLALYTEAHPFGFSKREKLENEWAEKNAAAYAEVEKAKGEKQYKVIEAEAKLIEANGKIYAAAFEQIKEAVKLGGQIANESRKNQHNEFGEGTKAMGGAITSLSNSLAEQVKAGAAERTELYLEREKLTGDRQRYLQLLSDIEEDKPVEVSQGSWAKIFGGFKKAIRVFEPFLKNNGIDLSPLLEENKEEPASVPEEDGEEEEET